MEAKRFDFMRHTLAWCKGEVFEGRMIVLFGLALLAVGLALWAGGTTPNARALILPALVISLLSLPTRFNLSRKNARDPNQFVQQERQRTVAA